MSEFQEIHPQLMDTLGLFQRPLSDIHERK